MRRRHGQSDGFSSFEKVVSTNGLYGTCVRHSSPIPVLMMRQFRLSECEKLFSICARRNLYTYVVLVEIAYFLAQINGELLRKNIANWLSEDRKFCRLIWKFFNNGVLTRLLEYCRNG